MTELIAPPVGAITATIQVRWADTDHYGHVNNVTWLRYDLPLGGPLSDESRDSGPGRRQHILGRHCSKMRGQ